MTTDMLTEFASEVDQAFYKVVHEYKKGQTPSGAVALAAITGKSSGVISNKANPNSESHIPTVSDLLLFTSITKDYRWIMSINTALGIVCSLPFDVADISDDDDLLKAYLAWHEETGDTAEKLKLALEDGRIDTHEMHQLKTEIFEDMSKSHELLQHIMQRAEEDNKR